MGILRLILAIAVIVGHAGGQKYFNFAWVQAFEAVNVFFIISGFYMALVLNERYATPQTNLLFYANRALRLYPLYFFGLICAVIGRMHQDALLPLLASWTELRMPQQLLAAMGNLTIFGLDWLYAVCDFDGAEPGNCEGAAKYTLNPPSWTLAAELTFYLLAPFVLRSPKRSLLLLAAGITYAGCIRMLPDYQEIPRQLTYNYYMFPASLLFFGMGGCGYHFIYRGLIMAKETRYPPSYYAIGLALFAAITLAQTILPWQMALLYGAAVPVLFQLTKHSKLDRMIGELSYPVYILHFPVLMVLWVEKSKQHITQDVVQWAVPVTLALAILATFLIERPVDRWRHRRSQALLAQAHES